MINIFYSNLKENQLCTVEKIRIFIFNNLHINVANLSNKNILILSESKLYVWNYFQIHISSIFNMDFIASTRSGGQLLVVEGFVYSKQKE